MGYYKNIHTHWGTVADAEEDARLDKRDRDADDGRFYRDRPKVEHRSLYAIAQMIDEDGFNWGAAVIDTQWDYEQYKAANPTWIFEVLQ
jgi:hypothetical protein